jgi:diadenosine tetraphosphate (Ap4A) HIT family hydrolase
MVKEGVPMSDCLVCREVSGEIEVPGGPVLSSELALAVHIPPLNGGDVYLGHLLIVTRRHVADFSGLNEPEASEIGVFMSRCSRALQSAGAERVYVATIGHSADHLHVHLLPRWPETPTEIPWHSVDDWEGARRADFTQATSLVEALISVLSG